MSQSFDDLMRASYEEVGIEASPFRLPATVRWLVGKIAALHPLLMSIVIWYLHRLWALGGRFHGNELARNWCGMARALTLRQIHDFCLAVQALDEYPTFREGCRQLRHANSLEAVFYRSGFLDAFFHQGDVERTKCSDPHQRPHFFVPGIPAQRYYDPQQFQWTEVLEKNAPVIREELIKLLSSPGEGFGNYRTEYGNLMEGWNAFHFWIQGEKAEDNCRRCPNTVEILESLEGMEREFILFSALNPKSRIIPHVGAVNGILRFHLPLLVPEGCGLRVGGIEGTWVENKVLVFDDSFVHEVWNRSDRLRVVLFINAWHPCLSQQEVEALSELQQAYDRFPAGENWKEAQRSLPPSTISGNS